MPASLFPVLKAVHVSAVALSAAGFLLRGGLMLAGSPVMDRRWVKIVPHVVDTILLLAAIGMVLLLGQYPFTTAWLTAKFLALVAYVVLGSIALRRGRTCRVRVVAWLAALGVLAYIVAVAMTHDAGVGLLSAGGLAGARGPG